MKLEVLEDVEFPTLGRLYVKGTIEVSEEEAEVLLTSPLIIKKQSKCTSKD